MFGPTDESKKRWRDDALRAIRAAALDMPPMARHDYAVWIANLATYVLCLTIDVSENGDGDRYWRTLDTPPPTPVGDLERLQAVAVAARSFVNGMVARGIGTADLPASPAFAALYRALEVAFNPDAAKEPAEPPAPFFSTDRPPDR